jgi:hypothetical protein
MIVVWKTSKGAQREVQLRFLGAKLRFFFCVAEVNASDGEDATERRFLRLK